VAHLQSLKTIMSRFFSRLQNDDGARVTLTFILNKLRRDEGEGYVATLLMMLCKNLSRYCSLLFGQNNWLKLPS